jgi:predicted amidophosphoribosyltransferase
LLDGRLSVRIYCGDRHHFGNKGPYAGFLFLSAAQAYKARAIQTVAHVLRAALNDNARQTLTFVPVPPSKAKTDPLYDDRLLQVLRGVWPGQAMDVRELIMQPNSSDAAHDRDDRPKPAELAARYVVERGLLHPKPQIVAVVDDLVTTGAHFVAMRTILRREFPNTQIVGLFIARRVPEAVDVEDFDT